MRRLGLAALLCAGLLLSGCGSAPLCGAAGAAGGAYLGHSVSNGKTGATVGGAAAGGLIGSAACD